MPVGSWFGAEACFIWRDMLVQIIEDDLVDDISADSGEITALPEALSPITFADMFKLLLYLAR